MDHRKHRPPPANRADDRDSTGPSAMGRHREGDDEHGNHGGSAAATWRNQGLDFVRDAIRLTYK
jgi:hypothetical protein